MSCFWRFQPVQHVPGSSASIGEGSDESLGELPPEWAWRTLDRRCDRDLSDLADLLAESYGEPLHELPATSAPPPQPGVATLRWLLGAPGGDPSWCFGLVDSSGRLKGSIAGLPLDLELDGAHRQTILVTLLCLHPEVRSRQLAPQLIAELTRRANARGIVSALFTSRRPVPVTTIGLTHTLAWPLRPRRLGDLGWATEDLETSDDDAVTPSKRLGLRALPTRAMTRKDLPTIHALLEARQASARLRPRFDLLALDHWLLGDSGVEAFVVVSDDDSPAAFGTFYRLDRSGGEPREPRPIPAFGFYQAAGSIEPGRMWATALDRAHRSGADLYLIPDGQLEPRDRQDLGFVPTTGLLGYHLFNWSHEPMTLQPSEIAVIPL